MSDFNKNLLFFFLLTKYYIKSFRTSDLRSSMANSLDSVFSNFLINFLLKPLNKKTTKK